MPKLTQPYFKKSSWSQLKIKIYGFTPLSSQPNLHGF